MAQIVVVGLGDLRGAGAGVSGIDVLAVAGVEQLGYTRKVDPPAAAGLDRQRDPRAGQVGGVAVAVAAGIDPAGLLRAIADHAHRRVGAQRQI